MKKPLPCEPHPCSAASIRGSSSLFVAPPQCAPLPLISGALSPLMTRNGRKMAASHSGTCRILPNEPILGRYLYTSPYPQTPYIQKSSAARQGPSRPIKVNQGVFMFRLPTQSYSHRREKPIHRPTQRPLPQAQPPFFSGENPPITFFKKVLATTIYGVRLHPTPLCVGCRRPFAVQGCLKQMWPLDGSENRATL